MGKETSSTLLTLSAAAIALLLASPVLPLSNILQPVQDQTPNLRTTEPAVSSQPGGLVLTFEALATANSSYPNGYAVNGKFEITNSNNGSKAYSSNIHGGGGFGYGGLWFNLASNYRNQSDETFSIQPGCDTSDGNNDIYFNLGTATSITFQGPVECPPSFSQGGGDTTAQPPSSTGSSQVTDRGIGSSSSNSKDADRDGIPDASDRCTHNSNPRCFKEGEATTTTTQQPPSSSTTRTGNQTG